jgi:predicted RNA-binding protein with PUA-like domain
MNYWLMKSEPHEYSIDDLVRDTQCAWFGVRNYQARNYMRDEMTIGDGVLFYHSSCPEPGIVGLAEVASAAKPDASQFDQKGAYYDPKSNPDHPRWVCVDVKLVRKTRLLALPEIRQTAALADMVILRKGNRLSVTPVSSAQWRVIQKLLQ